MTTDIIGEKDTVYLAMKALNGSDNVVLPNKKGENSFYDKAVTTYYLSHHRIFVDKLENGDLKLRTKGK